MSVDSWKSPGRVDRETWRVSWTPCALHRAGAASFGDGRVGTTPETCRSRWRPGQSCIRLHQIASAPLQGPPWRTFWLDRPGARPELGKSAPAVGASALPTTYLAQHTFSTLDVHRFWVCWCSLQWTELVWELLHSLLIQLASSGSGGRGVEGACCPASP